MKTFWSNSTSTKLRIFWVFYWKYVLAGLLVIVAIASFWVAPKLIYQYNTGIKIPKSLSAIEKQQDLDTWHKILSNPDQGKNHSTLYNDIGILRAGLKDNPGAVRAFKIAIAKNPNDARFYRNLAITYTNMNRYRDAETAFQHAFKVAPTQPEFWLELGELYSDKMKDNNKARSFYMAALTQTGNNLDVAQAYAQFLENVVKDYAEAIKYWQIVLDGVDPSKKLAFAQHIAQLKLQAGIK